MSRIEYSCGKEWYNLGYIEVLDADNAIFTIPTRFKIDSGDKLSTEQAWGALREGEFKGRFVIFGITDGGNEISGEFWFEKAKWHREDTSIWLKCEKTRRNLFSNFNEYLSEFPYA